jgi:hypothetical protein
LEYLQIDGSSRSSVLPRWPNTRCGTTGRDLDSLRAALQLEATGPAQ